jgi:predicted Zn-dependent peptidase
MQMETPDSVAETIARSIAIDGDLTGIETLYRNYESLTPDDILAAGSEIFCSDRRTVGVLTSARTDA